MDLDCPIATIEQGRSDTDSDSDRNRAEGRLSGDRMLQDMATAPRASYLPRPLPQGRLSQGTPMRAYYLLDPQIPRSILLITI